MTRLIPALCALAALACARGAPPPAGDGAAPRDALAGDTLRGTVRIAGSEPMTSVVLEPAGVALAGEMPVLRRLDGIEVVVEGEREAGGRFRVARVRVRAANGVPAVDGVLAREDGRDVLVLPDGGRRVIRRLPQALRGRTGARVWLAGPPDGDIDSFGVIADPR